MVTLKKLDSLILKCCTVLKDDSKDVTDCYSFSINFDKMENLLSAVDKNLHPFVIAKEYFSRPVAFEDLQNLTEYLHKSEEFDPIFDSKSEFTEFLIYCAQDKNGNVTEFVDEDGNKLAGYDAYKIFNEDGTYDLAAEQVQRIVQYLPMYMVLVIRSFDQKNYKYDYKIYIRSNYEMVSYFKAMSGDSAAEKDNKSHKK